MQHSSSSLVLGTPYGVRCFSIFELNLSVEPSLEQTHLPLSTSSLSHMQACPAQNHHYSYTTCSYLLRIVSLLPTITTTSTSTTTLINPGDYPTTLNAAIRANETTITLSNQYSLEHE